MKLSKAILRVFEVKAKPGQAGLLEQKLSSTSVSVVNGKPGNLGYFYGTNLSSDDDGDLVFVSVWENLESVKSHFGETWEESFLPEGYDDIIERCSIRHLEIDGSLISSAPADPLEPRDPE